MRQPLERNVPFVAPEGLLKCSASWLLCCVCALGCAATTPVASAPHRHWVPGYVFAIWGKAELDVRDDCPTTAAASVRVDTTWTTLLVSVVTLGMYTPREVRVTCQVAP